MPPSLISGISQVRALPSCYPTHLFFSKRYENWHILETFVKLKRSPQASLGGLPSLQHSRENSDLESSDCSRLVPQPLPLNASNGSTSNGHTSSSFQGKTVLEDTRWFVFALIVSPNRPGHYFVGGNDPVCLVSKERQDAESWSLRKTTIGLIRDDFWVNKWAILNGSM